MAPDEPEATFKVTDRRRRSDLDDAPAPDPPRPAVESARPAPPPRPTAPAETAPAPDGEERSLVGLFMMLGSSTLMALGEAEDPATGQRQRDLPSAADIIDVLVLLREKTEGRLSEEERQVLEEMLYDLQVRYVNASKQSE